MEDYENYSDAVYKAKLRELDPLSIERRFVLGDLLSCFTKLLVMKCVFSIDLPEYLKLIDLKEVNEPTEHRLQKASYHTQGSTSFYLQHP